MLVSEYFIGYIVAETPKAFLFHDHFWHNPDWMPKSQINRVLKNEGTHEVILSATAWICGQKNIQEFKEINNVK